MWKILILVECAAKWDFTFKTVYLPSKNLPKFEMISFVNVPIHCNLNQNNSNV